MNIADVVAIIAPQETRRLGTLLLNMSDGHPHSISELAHGARVSTTTAENWLNQLVTTGMASHRTGTGHGYFRLDRQYVPTVTAWTDRRGDIPLPRARRLSPQARRLQPARRCHGHLAGQLGVALNDQLIHRRYLVVIDDKHYDITRAGRHWFGELGIDVASLRPGKRGLAWPCIDWTERAAHLAGPLGKRLLETLCGHGWLTASDEDRIVTVTPHGCKWLETQLGLPTTMLAGAMPLAGHAHASR